MPQQHSFNQFGKIQAIFLQILETLSWVQNYSFIFLVKLKRPNFGILLANILPDWRQKGVDDPVLLGSLKICSKLLHGCHCARTIICLRKVLLL